MARSDWSVGVLINSPFVVKIGEPRSSSSGVVGFLFLTFKGAGKSRGETGVCGLANVDSSGDQCELSGDSGCESCGVFCSSIGGGGLGNFARLAIGSGLWIFARSAWYICTGSCTKTGFGADMSRSWCLSLLLKVLLLGLASNCIKVDRYCIDCAVEGKVLSRLIVWALQCRSRHVRSWSARNQVRPG